MKRNLMMIIPVLTLALIMIVTNAGYAEATSMEQRQPPVERQGQRGKWKYKAYRDREEGRIFAEVEYAHGLVSELQDLAAVQRQLAKELIASDVKSLDVTIVFRHPLNRAEFDQFVTIHGLETVSGYTLRYLDKQGQRVTINGAPSGENLVPQDLLELALNDVQQRSPGKLLGWVEMQATLTTDAYNTILSDKKVYLVDVTRSVVALAFKDDVKAQNLPVEVLVQPIYWSLEDLLLVSK